MFINFFFLKHKYKKMADTYISDIVFFLVTLMNGNNQYMPGKKLWQQIATTTTLNIGGFPSIWNPSGNNFTTLDPLNLGDLVFTSGGDGGCSTVCPCSGSTFWCCIGGHGKSGYAGVDIIQGIANAVADLEHSDVIYNCTSATEGTMVITIPVSTTATATCNYGFTLGIYVPSPCLSGDYTQFPVSTITVDVVISIPFTVVQIPNMPTTQSLLLDMSTCTLKVGNVRNLSFVQQAEADARSFLDGFTLGILAINSFWNDTFQPLFDQLNNFLNDKLNNDVLNQIPSNVISNLIPAAFSKLLMPLTGTPCNYSNSFSQKQFMERYNFVDNPLKMNNERVNQIIQQNKQKDELNRRKQNDRNRLSFQQSGINYPAHHYKSCCK